MASPFLNQPYVYVTVWQGKVREWPITLDFSYRNGSGKDPEQKVFQSLAEARRFLNELLKIYEVRVSKLVEAALSLYGTTLTKGSQFE